MGFKYFSNLMKQVVSIFLAHQNKAAHTFTDGFYALVAPKGYGLRLFSFVVSQMPLGFVFVAGTFVSWRKRRWLSLYFSIRR